MSEYQTYLKDCDCKQSGVLIHNSEVCCRWCRIPYAKGGKMNYLEEHFPSKTLVKDYEILLQEPDKIVTTFPSKYEKGKILSVKRLSDGDCFCVDEITDYGRITGFTIDERFISGLSVEFENGTRHSSLNHIHKVKPKSILFTSFDNVPIYEGDDYWYVSQWVVNKHCKMISTVGISSDFKYFSTEQAAKFYIEKHKPLFTNEDMERCFNSARVTLYPDVLNYKVFKYESYFDYKD